MVFNVLDFAGLSEEQQRSRVLRSGELRTISALQSAGDMAGPLSDGQTWHLAVRWGDPRFEDILGTWLAANDGEDRRVFVVFGVYVLEFLPLEFLPDGEILELDQEEPIRDVELKIDLTSWLGDVPVAIRAGNCVLFCPNLDPLILSASAGRH